MELEVFVAGSLLTIVVVLVYCNLGATPLWLVMIISVLMFVGVTSRIISSSALLTAIPDPADRGAFMGINSSVQQVSGGIASFVAGLIVFKTANDKLENYDVLGYVVAGTTLITIAMMYVIHKEVLKKSRPGAGQKNSLVSEPMTKSA